jgi:hypothetical protein
MLMMLFVCSLTLPATASPIRITDCPHRDRLPLALQEHALQRA